MTFMSSGSFYLILTISKKSALQRTLLFPVLRQIYSDSVKLLEFIIHCCHIVSAFSIISAISNIVSVKNIIYCQ